MLNPDEPFW